MRLSRTRMTHKAMHGGLKKARKLAAKFAETLGDLIDDQGETPIDPGGLDHAIQLVVDAVLARAKRPEVTEEMARDFELIQQRIINEWSEGVDTGNTVYRDALSEWLAKHFPAGESEAVELTAEQGHDLWEAIYESERDEESRMIHDYLASLGLKLVRVKPEAAKAETTYMQDLAARLKEAERKREADRLAGIERRLAALEARKPEPPEKSAGRVFSEGEVRAVLATYTNYYSASQVAERLGIDLGK